MNYQKYGSFLKDLPSGITNIKTINRRLVLYGLKSSLAKRVEHDIIKKRNRSLSRFGCKDLIELNRIQRPRRLEIFKKTRTIKQSKGFCYLNKNFKRKIIESIKIDDHYNTTKLIGRALLELITRESKKRGWQIYHTSKSCNVQSSRYIDIPNIGKARISDHELPQNSIREYNHLTFGKSWNGEVIINASTFLNFGKSYWLRKVLIAASGR